MITVLSNPWFDIMLAMKIDSAFLQTLASIFDNLSAGWFGAALIVPAFSGELISFNFSILITDIIFGTVCFVVAYRLRKLGGRK